MVIRRAKYKLGRKLGAFIHRKCQTQKFAVSEAKKKGIRRAPMSDYGRQLLEKQKVRFYYGITEKQLRRYVRESMKEADTNSALYSKLELRLDTIVHHSGLGATQPASRQLVSHGHITVNGRKVTIPSYQVRKGDVIAVRDASKTKRVFTDRTDEIKNTSRPAWMEFDPNNMSVTVKSTPEFDPSASPFDLKSVFEFYTR